MRHAEILSLSCCFLGGQICCLEAGLQAAPPLGAMAHVAGPGRLEAVGSAQQISDKAAAIAAATRAGRIGNILLCSTRLRIAILQGSRHSASSATPLILICTTLL